MLTLLFFLDLTSHAWWWTILRGCWTMVLLGQDTLTWHYRCHSHSPLQISHSPYYFRLSLCCWRRLHQKGRDCWLSAPPADVRLVTMDTFYRRHFHLFNELDLYFNQLLGSGPDGDVVSLHWCAARGQLEHWGSPDQHPQAGQTFSFNKTKNFVLRLYDCWETELRDAKKLLRDC